VASPMCWLGEAPSGAKAAELLVDLGAFFLRWCLIWRHLWSVPVFGLTVVMSAFLWSCLRQAFPLPGASLQKREISIVLNDCFRQQPRMHHRYCHGIHKTNSRPTIAKNASKYHCFWVVLSPVLGPQWAGCCYCMGHY